MATLSKTSDQLSTFNPVVKGLRCVIAKSEIKNDISSMRPKMRPAVRLISNKIKFMRRFEFLQIMEKAIEITPATSRAKSRPAQTVVRVGDGI